MAAKRVQQETASVPKEELIDEDFEESESAAETVGEPQAKTAQNANAPAPIADIPALEPAAANETISKRGQMQIARVRMRGFKSFRSADVKLESGFICLAGPNGSGKSNICDAIRFAFGESVLSNLRVRKVADLITQGSDKAEITVYLEGKGKRHEIKRAIRGDGKTAYRFDGKRCTRRALIDAIRPYGFEPTAHNVIAQGRVQEIVDMHPKERREILDAVSGISEFEDKKKEAMSKLGAVEQKINDAYIVLKEREGALAELSKQKEDALKHREVFDEVKKLKGSIIFHELNSVDKKHTQVAERYVQLKKDTDTLQKDIEVLQGRITELGAKKQELVNRINEKSGNEKTRRQLEELRAQVAIDKGLIEQKKELLQKNKVRIDALELELKELLEKAASSVKSVAVLKKNLEGVQKEVDAFENEHKELLGNAKKKAQKIAEMKRGLGEVSDVHAKMRETVSRLEMEADKELEIAKLKEEELMRTAPAAEEGSRKAELETEMESVKKDIEDLEKQNSSLWNDERVLQKKLPTIEGKQLGIKEELTELRVKVSPRGMHPGIALLKQLKEKNALEGIHGTVEDLIKVEPEYAIAMEASCAQRLNYVVVDSVDVAAEAIGHLKRQNAGRCSFIPLDKEFSSASDAVKGLEKKEGVHGLLIDLVQFSPEVYGAMQFVFGDTLVVDDIETAKNIGIGKARMVTLDGDLLEKSGIVTGGSFKSELKNRLKAEKLEKELEEVKAEREGIMGALERMREEMSGVRRRKADLEVKMKGIEIELKSLSAEGEKNKGVAQRVRELRNEVENRRRIADGKLKDKNKLAAETEEKKKELERMQKEIEELEPEAQKEVADEAQEKLKQLYNQKSQLEAKISHKENDEAKMLGERQEAVKKETDGLMQEDRGFRGDITGLSKNIEENSAAMLKIEETMRETSKQLDKLFGERDTFDAEINEIASQQGKLKFNYDRFMRELAAKEVEKATAETRLADLKAEYEEYRGIQPVEGSKTELQERLNKAGEMLGSLGNVNQRAPEQYEEMNTYIVEVKAKVGKLSDEKQAVDRMIQEIDTRKMDIFMDTFRNVDENFQKMFGFIFKGEGSLELEKPADPFNSGLTIKVKAGKKDKFLESMSGGEKSLLAFMFISAIQATKPMPYYILDEADAALDKENSKKMALLVKELSKTTQFLVVSHNDTVLSMADAAIGVTKSPEGHSIVVGVQLERRDKGGTPEQTLVASA